MILFLKKTDNGILAKVRPFIFERSVDLVEDFIKISSEKMPLSIDMTNRLPSSTTISSVTISATDLSSNSDVSVTVLVSTTGTISGNVVKGIVQSGTLNKDYQIKFTCTLSDSSILVEKLKMKIRDEDN